MTDAIGLEDVSLETSAPEVSLEAHVEPDAKPVLVVSICLYLGLGVLISVGICCTVNGLLAHRMYSPEKHLEFEQVTQVWTAPPNTLAGDAVVTCLVQALLTFFISGSLAMRDRRLNGYPLKVVGHLPPTWSAVLIRRMPQQYALFGPYLNDGKGAGGESIKAISTTFPLAGGPDVFSLPFKARLIGSLHSAGKIFGTVFVVFCLPLILVLWILVENAGDHSWDQASIVQLKIIPFGCLQTALQVFIASHPFAYSDKDDAADAREES